MLILIHSTTGTGDALNLPAVLAGTVVAFLLLTLLIAEIIVGAALLKRKAHKERMLSQRNAPQQIGSITISQAKQQRKRRVQRSTLPMMLVMTSPLMGERGCTRGWM